MKPKSEAMASVHEAISDLYGIGGVDKATMRHFDAICLECSVPDTRRRRFALCVPA